MRGLMRHGDCCDCLMCRTINDLFHDQWSLSIVRQQMMLCHLAGMCNTLVAVAVWARLLVEKHSQKPGTCINTAMCCCCRWRICCG
jgi:hypothetical protein